MYFLLLRNFDKELIVIAYSKANSYFAAGRTKSRMSKLA